MRFLSPSHLQGQTQGHLVQNFNTVDVHFKGGIKHDYVIFQIKEFSRCQLIAQSAE